MNVGQNRKHFQKVEMNADLHRAGSDPDLLLN